MVSRRALLALGLCLSSAAGDRREAATAARRNGGRFHEAELAMSRLQLASEEQGSALDGATACHTAEVIRLETKSLKVALLQRMATEHGAVASSKLEAAFGRKGDEKSCDEAGAREMSSTARTDLMMKMKPKDLVTYWMPDDCHSIMESEEGKATMEKIEKEFNTGKPPEVDVGETTEAQNQEEKQLKDHCHKLVGFLTQAAHQLQVVKKAIANDADQKVAPKKTDAPGTNDADQKAASKTSQDTPGAKQPAVEVTKVTGPETEPKTLAQNTPGAKQPVVEPSKKGSGSFIQLSSMIESEAHGLRELFDSAMGAFLGTITERLTGKPAVASIQVDAEASTRPLQQRERRSKQVARQGS